MKTITNESNARVIRLPKATKELAQLNRTASATKMEDFLADSVEKNLPKIAAELTRLGFDQFAGKSAVTKWSLTTATLEALRGVSEASNLPMNLLLALCITHGKEIKGEAKTVKAAKPVTKTPAKAPKAKVGRKSRKAVK